MRGAGRAGRCHNTPVTSLFRATSRGVREFRCNMLISASPVSSLSRADISAPCAAAAARARPGRVVNKGLWR